MMAGRGPLDPRCPAGARRRRRRLSREPQLLRLEYPPDSPLTAGNAGRGIPENRPDVTLADRDGKLRSLSGMGRQAAGHQFLGDLVRALPARDPDAECTCARPALAEFALIGIAIDFREDVLRFLEETPIDYTVLIGEQDGLDASRAFGMESLGLPFTAFIDKSGRIVTIHVGELHRSQADVILSAVRAVDAGEIDLQTAQQRIRTRPQDRLIRRQIDAVDAVCAFSGHNRR